MAPYIDDPRNRPSAYESRHVISEEDATMPIAVIGMSFHGPGDATNVDNLCKLIAERRETWSEVPSRKWNHDAFYHPDSARTGSSHVQGGHYLSSDPAKFDARFFNMTAEEAAALDPQQRMLLECSFEVLENAGIPLHKAYGSNTSVFVGTFATDYTETLYRDTETMPTYQATNSGNSRAIISNRLSYFFDFRGPSVTVDTACSASMVAFHLGCQSLRTGEADQVIVGGSSVILSPDSQISMSAMGFLSPDGRCHTFSDAARGYGRSEGAGCILLKPLDIALRDGDPIRAVVRGTSSNQDGKTPGISFPSQQAQEDLILKNFQKARISTADVGYHELHGTGTAAGDPIEAAAIYNTLCKSRSARSPLRIGSVKTNVGHMEAASGIASLIKCVSMLETEKILPSINHKRPNPRIPMNEWHLKFCTEAEPWGDAPKRISVSGFGYGGTNAHAILDQAAEYLAQRGMHQFAHSSIGQPGRSSGCFGSAGACSASKLNTALALPLSASSDDTLKDRATDLASYLRKRQHNINETFLDDLAHTLETRRSRFARTAVVSAKSLPELVEKLEKHDFQICSSTNQPSIAFVFTGQGAQWAGMGRELINAFPVYRRSLEDIAAITKGLGAGWDVIEELQRDDKSSRVNEPLFSQPLCSAIQIALVNLLASWGIEPRAVTGHSSGEIAAAYAAGSLTLKDAISAAYFRGLAADKMRNATVRGAMMAVGISAEEVQPILDSLKSGKVVVACENSPTSTTCSGDLLGVEELGEFLHAKGVFARKLALDVAYHSPHMELIGNDYSANIPELAPHPQCKARFFSSVTGDEVSSSSLGPSYWVENMLGRVRFNQSFGRLCHFISETSDKQQRQIDYTIEIGPHSALAGPIKQILKANCALGNASIRYASALVRKENAVDTVLQLVSQLYANGHPMNLAALNHQRPRKAYNVLTDLPSYPWDHTKSYWAESRISKAYRRREQPRRDILGVQDFNFSELEPRWRNIIRTSETPWIQDHKVQSNVIWPGAGFLAMAIQASATRSQKRGLVVDRFAIREVTISQALIFPAETGQAETLFCLRPQNEGTRIASETWDEFSVYSVLSDNSWTLHCHGFVKAIGKAFINLVDEQAEDPASLRHKIKVQMTEIQCQKDFEASVLYEQLHLVGLEYGPTFANIKKLKIGRDSALASIAVPFTSSVMPMGYEDPVQIHPATLDSSFHAIFAGLFSSSGGHVKPMVPSFIQEISVLNDSRLSEEGHMLNVYATINEKKHRTVETSVLITDGQSNGVDALIDISGLILTTLPSDDEGSNASTANGIAFRIDWQPHPAFNSPLPIRTAETEEALRLNESTSSFLVQAALLDVEQVDLPENLSLAAYVAVLRARELAATTIASTPTVPPNHVLRAVGSQLPKILCGTIEPVAALKSVLEGRPKAVLEVEPRLANLFSSVASRAFINPSMRVLEIGLQGGRWTIPLLAAFSSNVSGIPQLRTYQISTKNDLVVETIRKICLSSEHLVSKVDVNLDRPSEPFDLILISGALSEFDASSVKKLLTPLGQVLELPALDRSVSEELVFGGLPGWLDTFDDAASSQDSGKTNGLTSGVTNGITNAVVDKESPAITIISSERCDLAEYLKHRLAQQGFATEQVTPGSFVANGKVLVVLADSIISTLTAPTHDQLDTMKSILLRSKASLWITSGSHSSNPSSSLVAGLNRTARSENGGNRLITLDFDNIDILSDENAAAVIGRLLKLQALPEDSATCYADVEFREIGGLICVPRLVPDTICNTELSLLSQKQIIEDQPIDQSAKNLRLEISTPGMLDAIRFVEDPAMSLPLQNNEVEIEVQASGVNFRDVMMCLGQIDVEELGAECSGIVSGTGPSVAEFAIGDRVACCHMGAFANRIRAKAVAVQKIPNDMSFATAAAIPVAYCTAYYALLHIGRLTAGETILIHAASGGLGQAAIELAQNVGATVFATVGTPEKKKFLISRFGIPALHIFYSRGTTFADQVMELTNGKGVDMVLNSVAGEALRLTWNCIGSFGRFLEVGKRDFFVNSYLEMSRFAKNVTFAAVDLVGLLKERPAIAGSLWKEVMTMLQSGKIRPMSPITECSFANLSGAFRTMQLGKHIGKLVAVRQQGDLVKVRSNPRADNLLSANASYVLVGGLGGIGRAMASWMISRGARNLILVNRSGASRREAQEAVKGFVQAGASVHVGACDISDADAVNALFEECATTMPPIKGVIQGAMVLRDGMLENMTSEDYTSVLDPKVKGTWNLHNALPRNLDFFIMLSSISGVMGNSSQASYAAANSFLDAFAGFRCQQGLPGMTIDLGVVADVGYVAENKTVAEAMKRQGFEPLSKDTVLGLVEYAVRHPFGANDSTQIVTGMGTYTDTSPSGFSAAMFTHFRAASQFGSPSIANSDAQSVRTLLRKASTIEDATAIICRCLMEKVATLAMVEVETIKDDKPMSEYGIDSIVAVEMRNGIFRDLDARVPILDLLSKISLRTLAGRIAEQTRLVSV